jgi:hypothetical protein
LASKLEAGEKEQQEALEIRLEGIVKRYRYGNRTLREIGVSRRLSDEAEIEKYDRATEKGQRYCVIKIKFLPRASISSQRQDSGNYL